MAEKPFTRQSKCRDVQELRECWERKSTGSGKNKGHGDELVFLQADSGGSILDKPYIKRRNRERNEGKVREQTSPGCLESWWRGKVQIRI